MKLDVLAFSSHPDDAELSCSGLLLKEKAAGRKIGIVDLTEGELGSRGSIESRREESKKASEILGLDIRENLGLRDGFFLNNEENQLKVISAIRKYRPDVVLCNSSSDRHPDHAKGYNLVSDAAFLSGLIKIETLHNGANQEAWRPSYVFSYIQDRFLEPDFIIDITDVFELKMKATLAYESQFYKKDMTGTETYISSPSFMDNHINRHKIMGKMIGVTYGEGYLSDKKIGLPNLDSIIKKVT
jgi:hypothetical protein